MVRFLEHLSLMFWEGPKIENIFILKLIDKENTAVPDTFWKPRK